ncbi:PREDICTED: RNA-binding protein 44 [Tinamus guttatus]|nr:PREDICTED: RNA-binding protein 44 [Tinamus guttatus]
MELEKNSSVKSKPELFVQTSHLLSYSEKVEHTVIRDLAAEVNCSGFGQACSVNVSELKLSEESLPYLASSLDEDLEMYNEERATICCACGYEREKEADMPGRACNDKHFVCRVGDGYRQSDLSEDSQLEYVSSDEQDYYDRNSSSEFCKQMKTVGIETLQLVDPVHEVPGNGIRKEQDLVNILEGCSTSVDKSGGNVRYLKPELERLASLDSVTSDSKVTVNQTVDASSDFRACFTTSRATNAQVCLVSRAVNTDITMMNKSRPVEWRREVCADVACNTDWSWVSDSTEETWPQFADILGKHLDGNTAAAETSQIQDPWESRNEPCSTARPLHLEKQSLKDSICCRKLLWRAVQAELQVLNMHYQMCCHHCYEINKLMSEEEKGFYRCIKNGLADTELNASLLSVLEELKKSYETMKKKIEMGVPLSALPSLSVETRLFTLFSSYVPGKDNPQTVHLTSGTQPRHSTTSKTFEDYHKDQDVEYECRKNEEMNEYWFDAKENLAATDFSATFDEKQQEKQDTDSPREMKIMENAGEVFFILVGGLNSSVSEGDLRSYFQKYEVNNILICVDSSDYRYAFLCFKDANKAKLAVEEMNRKEIKGKTVSVELVKNASGNRASVFQNLLTKFWYEIQSINSQNSVQDKTFTSASNSVKAPATTSASEKVLLLSTTSSKITHCSPASSKTKQLDAKSSTEGSEQSLVGVNQKKTEENSLQKTSALYFPDALDTFIPPNTLNLSSFTKLMKKLQEIHPETSREKIIDALLQVRTNNKGILSGLSINSIVKRTSLILRKSMPKSGGKKE